MLLKSPGRPLECAEVPTPRPAAGQLLVRVAACAVCRTDLHVIDGELPDPKLPLILGHEIVGQVAEVGPEVEGFRIGERVGIPWLGWTCGRCTFCLSGRENLCERARFTGYTIDGGYAEYTVADARFCFRIPDAYDDVAAAPLLCAGLIGYRCLRKVGDARRLGIYGFGAAAHIIAQVARHQSREVFAFTTPGDTTAQEFARRLGAKWAGGSDEAPTEALDGAIIFAPVGALVPAALRDSRARRRCRVRRNSHERHSFFSVPRPVGGANDLFRRQSHPAGWRRVSRPRAASSRAHRDTNIPARARERRVARATRRRTYGRSCPCPLVNRLESFAESWLRKGRFEMFLTRFYEAAVIGRQLPCTASVVDFRYARDGCGIQGR